MESVRPGRGQRSRRCSESPPARLRRGIEQFNRGEFYEQHETLEEEWLAERDPVRYLYQGILQIGVGFEHLRRGNPTGARGVGWTVVFVVLIAIAIVGYTLGLREWRRERHTGRQRPTR